MKKAKNRIDEGNQREKKTSDTKRIVIRII